MNWGRILRFTILLFVATFVATIPFGIAELVIFAARQTDAPLLHHAPNLLHEPMPDWISYGRALAALLSATLVFRELAKRQDEDRPWQHALVVAFITWLVAYQISAFGQPVQHWLGGIVVLLAAVGLGVALRPPSKRTSKDGHEPAG